MKKLKSNHIILNYKHRLYPTKSQIVMLDQQMFVANQVFNIVLQLLKDESKKYKKAIAHKNILNVPNFYQHFSSFSKSPINKLSDTDLDRKVNSILNTRSLYGELDTRQQARKIAKSSYFDGFKPHKEPAKFHRYDQLNGAFSGVNARTKIGDKYVKLSTRIGFIKMKRERPFPEGAKVKTVRIKKENNKYYAIFGLELTNKIISDPSIFKDEIKLGMDTNNGHLDFSDGSVIKYDRALNYNELIRKYHKGKRKKSNHQKRITKLLNELSIIKKLEQKQSKRIETAKKTKIKTGKNYVKDRLKLAKKKEKLKNRRKNILDNVSNEILSKAFSVLFLEDLSVKEMTKKTNDKKQSNGKKNKVMRKNILNFSYSELHSKLYYKAMLMNRLVLFIDPAYTTQECSCCGRRQKMPLSARRYECECGLNLDRDLNSAINIKSKGEKTFFEDINTSSLACA